jgi:putative lipase involved disintegration of autophagic bodies
MVLSCSGTGNHISDPLGIYQTSFSCHHIRVCVYLLVRDEAWVYLSGVFGWKLRWLACSAELELLFPRISSDS